MHGQFVWYDLMTTDIAAARDFYTRVAGWSLEPFGGDPGYMMFKAPARTLGGAAPLAEEAKAMGAPPHWLGYVDVDDVDVAVAKVQELGGAVLQDAVDLDQVGRFAIVADPGGAVFALYKGPSDEPWDPGEPQVGLIGWHELAVADLDGALAFYGALLGWSEVERMDMGPELGPYSLFSDGHRRAGGMWLAQGDMPPAWLFYVQVADLEASMATARELGGEIVNGPQEVPGGDVVAQVRDPQGAVFALVYTPPASP